MSDQEITQDQLQALLQYASKKLGTTPDKLAKTVQQGGVSALSSHLSADDAAKISAVANDQKKAEQILQSPEAQRLIKQILGNKK